MLGLVYRFATEMFFLTISRGWITFFKRWFDQGTFLQWLVYMVLINSLKLTSDGVSVSNDVLTDMKRKKVNTPFTQIYLACHDI